MKGRIYRFGCLMLTVCLLWAVTGCGHDASAPGFPPKEETVRTAAEKLGWTLDPEGPKSGTKSRVSYGFQVGDLETAVVSCDMAGGNRYLTEAYSAICLPDKPEFSWEDWKDVVTMAETLYGGLPEGELYEALSQSTPELPPEGTEASTDEESFIWEVELPAGYGRVWWSVSPGTVEKNFPSPVVQDWRLAVIVSLYESREAYESMTASSD